MEQKIGEIACQMFAFNDLLDSVDVNEDRQIVEYCEKVVSYVNKIGLVCPRYDAYKAEWERFHITQDVHEKNLHELFTYLIIYSRWEHMTGDYGSCYVDAFRSGAIPALIREIARRTERMARMDTKESDKTGHIGIAGEYFVAAELTRRGYVASLTSKNTKSVDILASDKDGVHSVSIQVKTCDDPKRLKWKMSSSVEQSVAPNLYYVFVNMNGGDVPSYYVVPSKYVAYRAKEDYENWLHTPGKKGQQRNETTMRTFEFVDKDESCIYQDAWHLLGI